MSTNNSIPDAILERLHSILNNFPHFNFVSDLREWLAKNPEAQQHLSSLLHPSPVLLLERLIAAEAVINAMPRHIPASEFKIATERWKELSKQPLPDSAHPSPVNEDWKVQVEPIYSQFCKENKFTTQFLYRENVFLFAEKLIKWISQNVPSQGYSLEQVEDIIEKYNHWASVSFLNEGKYGKHASLDELVAEGKQKYSFKKWSQTDQGKELLKLNK